MRLLISFFLIAGALPAQQFGYAVLGHNPRPWNEVLSSVGLPGAPPGLMLSVNGLRGPYLLNSYNPQRPNFFDFRAGFWYAFTH